MVYSLLHTIYENETLAKQLEERVRLLVSEQKQNSRKAIKEEWDEKDVFLITYGDQFKEEKQATLETFLKFFNRKLSDTFSIVHFLPFFPYSSDDGFSVKDFEMINPELGTWEDVARINEVTRLMFDFVCNHMSAQSEWFSKYLAKDKEYADYFINIEGNPDLSKIVRPRTSPLLTEFTAADGEKLNIWTTFSDDQVDLNFSNPEVLIRMLEIILFYAENGAEFIRLDAIGYLWKEIGTSSIHHPKTHAIVQLFRKVLDIAYPGTVLITETNVPHLDNISYFGDGYNEAQMVYQFPLPPLVLYTIRNGESHYIKQWAANIETPSEETTFFNFLASHDGIGLNPARGIIPEEEIISMVDTIVEQGALVNYKKNDDGTESPYELNVTYLDALSNNDDSDEIRIKRFLVAHSILLTMVGAPAVYIQSVLGSRNYYEGVKETGMNRTINREKYQLERILAELEDETSLRHKIFNELTHLIQSRKNIPGFHPNAELRVLPSSDKLFVYQREHQGEAYLIVHNISQEQVEHVLKHGHYYDLLENQEILVQDNLALEPYDFKWLKILN